MDPRKYYNQDGEYRRMPDVDDVEEDMDRRRGRPRASWATLANGVLATITIATIAVSSVMYISGISSNVNVLASRVDHLESEIKQTHDDTRQFQTDIRQELGKISDALRALSARR